MHTHSSHFNDQSYSDSDDMCANDVVFCTPTITASKWRKINHIHEKKTTTNSKSNNKLIKSRWFCAVAIVVLGERRMSEEEGVGQKGVFSAAQCFVGLMLRHIAVGSHPTMVNSSDSQ